MKTSRAGRTGPAPASSADALAPRRAAPAPPGPQVFLNVCHDAGRSATDATLQGFFALGIAMIYPASSPAALNQRQQKSGVLNGDVFCPCGLAV